MSTNMKIDMNKVGQISLRLNEKQGIQNYRDSMPL